MGANAQTTVPTFVSGQTLLATQVNQINTGVPVASGTATRDDLFGGSGEKTLAEGQLVYLEDLDIVQYYDGSSWLTLGPTGLQLVKTQTIGTTVSTVTVTGAFSADYDNYKIMIAGGAGSTDINLLLTLGSTATGYYYGGTTRTPGGVSGGLEGNNATSFLMGSAHTNGITANVDVISPFATKRTHFTAQYNPAVTNAQMGTLNGFLNDNTSYTAFSIALSSGTLTGGTIRVYGYRN